MNATEVQAEIYRLARNRGWDMRLQVACGVDHDWNGQRRTKSCRFDLVLMSDGRMIAIIECKPGDDEQPWQRSKRRQRYESHGVPVIFAGPRLISAVIDRLAKILTS